MQRLEEQEDIGRARARQRRHRVELHFLADPEQLAGRREQGDRVGAILVGDRRAREQPGDALADQRRRVRHDADDALAAGRGDDRIAAHAGHDADVQRAGDMTGAAAGRDLEVLRLDRPDEDLGHLEKRPGAERALTPNWPTRRRRVPSLGSMTMIEAPGGQP